MKYVFLDGVMNIRDNTVNTVALREFKEFVRNKYGHDSPFYQVIMAERDEMSCEEYASKFLTWLKLIGLSSSARPEGDHHS